LQTNQKIVHSMTNFNAFRCSLFTGHDIKILHQILELTYSQLHKIFTHYTKDTTCGKNYPASNRVEQKSIKMQQGPQIPL